MLSKNLTLMLMDEAPDGGSLSQESLKLTKLWFHVIAPKYCERIETVLRELTG